MAKILAADDELVNRELLVEILEPEGFEIRTVSDGAACLDELWRFQPDVVLLDVNMPKVNGFQVCGALKQDPDTRLIPVVLITALSALEDRVQGISAGADDFLTKPIDRTQLVARVRALANLKEFTDELERAESVLFALARSIEGKDPYTRGHCERLAEYSARLGEHIGLSDEEILALRRAGVVHDIGKVAVPDAILLKPARLTPAEHDVMKQHTLVGEQICAPLKSFRPVLPIIRHHHEKMDGSGYPDGLRGEEIPLTARILQLADVFDALNTERPYKPALSCEDALATMEEEVNRGWWDPRLFSPFKEVMSPAA